MRSKRGVWGALAAILSLPACQSLDKDRPATVSSAEQAASLEITPSSIEPWASAYPALAPNMTMTGDAALAKVLPTTERITEQTLQAFEGSVAIGLPQSSSSSTATQTQNGSLPAAATNGSTNQQTTTTTSGPGVVPTLATGAPAGASPPSAASAGGDLGTDPVMAARAANYLNQIVQLMNRELQNAPQRRCYAPYLVKLKIAVMPYRSRLPYALHTRIGFFDEEDIPGMAIPGQVIIPPDPSRADPATLAARQEALTAAKNAEQAVDDAKKAAKEALASADKSEAAARRAAGASDAIIAGAEQAARRAAADADCGVRQVPMVLPIIAADDMQVALKSKAVEVAQQLGVALQLMVHGVGANVGARNLRQSIDAILSHDLSSSLTVTRSSENVLYMRIAPNNEPSGEPALVGQTYDIAALLLVPVAYLHRTTDPGVKFDVVTEYRDARDGKILASAPDDRRLIELDRIVTPFLSSGSRDRWKRFNPETRLYIGDRLSRATTSLDLTKFMQYLQCLPGDDDGFDRYYLPNTYDRNKIKRGCLINVDPYQTRYVMTAMGSYVADSPLRGGIIDIPRPTPIGLPDQTVIVADNGTTAASATLSGVRGSASSHLQGYLELMVKKDARRVAATGTTFDPLAHTLTFTFPSPATFKTDKESWEATGNSLQVEQICDNEREWCADMLGPPDFVGQEKVRIVTKTSDIAGTSKMTLAASAQSIIYDGSSGTLSVAIGKLDPTEKAILSVSNADLNAASDSVTGALQITGDGAAEPKNGYVTLSLSNLNGGAVTITATAKVGTKTTGTVSLSRPLSLKPKSSGEK